MLNPLIRKFDSKMELGSGEKEALARLTRNLSRLRARRDIYVDGDPTSSTSIILEGWACRYSELEDGRRQIVELFIPGDILGYNSLPFEYSDHSACAISSIAFAQVSRDEFQSVMERYPRIADAVRWDMSVSAAINREWILSLGRLDATQRMAHLFCELFYRSAQAGLSNGFTFDFPIGQRELADVLGLSTVQVSRKIMRLRSEGLLRWRHRVVDILDLDRLASIGMFRPDYLHLRTGETPFRVRGDIHPHDGSQPPSTAGLPGDKGLPIFK